MLRWIASPFVGALLIAPLGFGERSPALVTAAARVVFGLLLLLSIAFVLLAAAWSRRWRMQPTV